MAKMNSWQGCLAYWFLKSIAFVLQRIPLSWGLNIGRVGGWCVYFFHTKARKKVLSHLRMAWGLEWDSEQIQKTTKEFFISFGQNIIEIARLPLLPKHGYQDLVALQGDEQVAEILKEGKGCFFLSIHKGNWELANIVGSLLGHPYNMVANSQEHIDKVAEFLSSLRQSGGGKIIYPGLGGRDIIKAIKNNEIVTIVADQGGRDGVLTPFFGREAPMSTGAVRLALKYGTPILMVNITRTGSRGQHLLMAQRFDLVKTGDLNQDVSSNIRRMGAIYEQWIRESPCEYVWIYKTWKYTTDRVIVILDDGRTGHLRQSQAIAQALWENLKTHQRQPTIYEIPIHFKNPFLAKFVSCLPLWIQNMIWGNFFGFAKKILTPECFEHLFSHKADYVISTGSQTTQINYRYTQFNDDARSIVVMDSKVLPLSLFSFVVLPRHDEKKNKIRFTGVTVEAAPNQITDEYLEKQKEIFVQRFPLLMEKEKRYLGVLMGGDTKGVVMSASQISSIIKVVKTMAESLDYHILVTTSRRTPPHIEALLEKELKNFARTDCWVSGHQKDIPEAMGGILALSKAVLVSGESISMISEAASSKATTMVFDLMDAKGNVPQNKYTRFVDRMKKENFVLRTDEHSFPQEIQDVFVNQKTTKRLEDLMKVKKELQRILR